MQSISASKEAVCRKAPQEVNARFQGTIPYPKDFLKKLYVSQNRQLVAAWLDQSKLLVRNPRKPKKIATKPPRSSATPNAMRRPDGGSGDGHKLGSTKRVVSVGCFGEGVSMSSDLRALTRKRQTTAGCRGKHADLIPGWGRWLHRLVRCFHSPLIDRMNPGRSSSRYYRIRKSREMSPRVHRKRTRRKRDRE